MNIKKKLSLILAAALLLPMMFACTPEEPAVTTDGDTTTDITTEDPDMTTTTAPADDGTTTVAPDADTTTTAPADDGTTTTVAPDADTTTTAAPDADTTTTAAPGGSDDDPDGTPTYPAWTATEEDDVCDILMIGNSFCQNYSDELYAMAKAAGIKCRITSVVAGACTLEMHWDYYSNEKAMYAVTTYDKNGRTSAGNQTLQAALALADWDIISYQDGEHYYRIEGAESAKTHMEPYLENLVGAIRAKFPNATHYFHQVWAYQVGYYRPDKSEFKVTDSTVQATMHSDLRDMSLYACDKHDLLRIPSGDAWANARADERIGDVLCMGDNEHDSERTGGQYLNACVWFETLFGKSCVGNFIDSPYLSDDTMTALQEMAHRAVADACGEAFAAEKPVYASYTAWTATEEDDVCDILMIGNSFCQNYADELYAMAKAAGIKCRITSAAIGAGTLEMHWDAYTNQTGAYAVTTYDANGRLFEGNKSLQYALSLADWDIISYQHGGHYYRTEGLESAKAHMEPSLGNLVAVTRERFPNATHYFHQAWAYQVGYSQPEKSDFVVTDSTVQATMHNGFREMALYACKNHDLLRVPSGDAWAYARADARIGDVLCMGDKLHDSERTGGQYLNACVWFETLFGKSCVGNFIDSPYLSDDTMTALQEMAHRAVADACGGTHAYDVPTLTFPEPEPEDTIPDHQKLPIDFTGNPDKGTSSLASSDFLKIGYDKDYSVYLGNLDMSKLLGVRITYGGDSSLPVKDLPIGLTSKDQAFGTKNAPDLTDAIVYTTMTEIVHSYTKGANVVTIEWMDALYSGDLYLAIPDAGLSNYLQIYAVEFILMPDNLDDPNNLEIDIDNHPNKSISGTLNRNVLTLDSTTTTVTLGEIDLSKYKSVWIYYGGDAAIASDGKPIGLLTGATLDSASGTAAANVLAHGKMVDIEGRHPGAYGTRIDLSGVTYNGELFLTVFGFTRHAIQIYSIEFIVAP